MRDLPSKDGSVEPDNDFAMRWEVDGKSAKRLSEIAEATRKADRLILATDPDREVEAISWHVLEDLKRRKALGGAAVERVVFNAITKSAVTDAMRQPRAIDMELVNAYLARRALDYLVGFTLSPVLWRKLPGARSAGPVQSVALRLVVEREMEIGLFGRGNTGASRPMSGRRTICSPRGWSSTRAVAWPGSTSPTKLLPRRPASPWSTAISPCRRWRRSRPAAFLHRPSPHLHAPAGGLAQAGLLGRPDHEGGPAPLRGR